MDEISKRVLLVDDDANLLDGLRRQLRKRFQITTCASAIEALRLLETEEPFAVVVSDFQMPEMDGVQFLSRAKQISPSLVPVMMTAWGDLEQNESALNDGGIHRFLSKPCSRELLESTLTDCLEQYRLVAHERQLMAEVKEANAQLSQRNEQLEKMSEQLVTMNLELERLARIDGLTGLLNRRAWAEVALMQQEVARREDLVLAVIMLDVDHFKSYNDTFGHQAGDRCLSAVARCIQSMARSSDACGRYGGEEFIVACLHHSMQEVAVHAERLRAAIQGLHILHPQNSETGFVTASVGCSSGISQSWEILAQQADAALYAAKKGGRNRVCDWTDELVMVQTCL